MASPMSQDARGREPTDIRPSGSGDLPSLRSLYREAFPEEELFPLLEALYREPQAVHAFVALSNGGAIAGHIVLSTCEISKSARSGGLLGPLAVAATQRGQGVGGALIRHVVDHAQTEGLAAVCVLGDPNYYGRFGFEVEDKVSPPYPLPTAWATAWRAIRFDGGALSGELVPPPPWREPALWTDAG